MTLTSIFIINKILIKYYLSNNIRNIFTLIILLVTPHTDKTLLIFLNLEYLNSLRGVNDHTELIQKTGSLRSIMQRSCEKGLLLFFRYISSTEEKMTIRLLMTLN